MIISITAIRSSYIARYSVPMFWLREAIGPITLAATSPTTPPNTIIMTGSIMEARLSITVSTSSS
jgi:hypothetical protein